MKTILTKVTIITEGILREKMVELIRKHGATGYTLTKVEGEGSRGVRASDWEGRNICVETLVTAEVADIVLEELNTTFFEDYSVIAWLSEVNVLRGDKFTGKKGD
jgi:nitrogen regulatory protein P-II 2